MRRLKKTLGFVLAGAMAVTALPVEGIDLTADAAMAPSYVEETVRLIPSEASVFHDTNGDGFGEFEGWGTSLCWWANRLGYSDAMTEQAAEMFFGDSGLDMNIGRYNVGGGDNTTDRNAPFYHAPHIKRSDSVVPGYATDVTKIDTTKMTMEEYKERFVRVDEECGYAWNYDWNADKNQMNILLAAAKASGIDFIAEAFSNSPPYFMTESGCSSGNADANRNNLREDSYQAFATYMADVIVHWTKEGVINFQSATPMNEPDTNYWGANSNKQEGCHFDPGTSQSKIIVAMANEIKAQAEAETDEEVKAALNAIIYSASDETSIDSAINNYKALSSEAKEVVTRIDTHTYSGSKRTELCELAETSGENLWMSEIDGAFVAGTDAGEMGAALGLAQRIMTDLNGLKSTAWILWNAVDMHVDADASRDGGFDHDSLDSLYSETSMNGGYWGIAIGDHNNQKVVLTKKYYGFGQFSRYIRPGDTIIGTTNSNTLVAYNPDDKQAIIVALNTSIDDSVWKFDLSSFSGMGNEIQAIRSSGSLATGENWADVTSKAKITPDTVNRNFVATLKGNSITTFIVEDVTYDKAQDSYVSISEIPLNPNMVVGSTPWNGDQTNGVANVVDGSTGTFFDGVENGFVRVDLGDVYQIDAVGYAPRSGYTDRNVGASFYGSNDGTNWTKLYTITAVPSAGTITTKYVNEWDKDSNCYRYIRYAVPEDGVSCCNIAELKLYGAKADLSSAIANYEKKLGQHDFENTAAFEEVLANAKDVEQNTAASATEKLAALTSLVAAYDALVENRTYLYTSISGVKGAELYDTNGVRVQAHGGQIQKLTYDMNNDGDTTDEEDTFWFWVGEDKTNDYRPCPGIHAYISYDLYNWQDMGLVLKTATNYQEFISDEYFTSLYGHLSEDDKWRVFSDIWKGESASEGCVIERPKMLYNEKNNNYVIWFHADGQIPDDTSGGDYAKAKAGVAVSDSPFGPFELKGSYLLNYDENASHGFDGNVGGHVRDMNLFKDDDGTGYVLYSSDGNETLHIARLNEDYTNVAKLQGEAELGVDFTRNFIKESREAPAMFKYHDKYYMITSGCTGWNPNQASYAVADHPLGPWKTMGDPCTDSGYGTTYDTQSTCVFPVDAANGKFIYMGDRWHNPDKGGSLRDSRYVWLPVEFMPGDKIALRRYSNWTLEDLENKGLYQIQTELPTTATSVEDLEEKLPETITIKPDSGVTKDVDVSWTGLPTTNRPLGTVNVTGTMSDGRSIVHTVNMVDEKLIYFFDNSKEESDYVTTVKEVVGTKLRNKVADQKYTLANRAGYTGTIGTDIGIKDAGDDVWAHGYYAMSAKNIEYAFELEAGSYTIATGYQEWWNTSRPTAINVTAGGRSLAYTTFTLGSKDTNLQKNVSFTLDKAAVVKLTVSRTGNPDPVMSWIAVMQDEKVGELADKEELHTTIDEVNKLDSSIYTKDSWKALQDIYKAAVVIQMNAGATEEEINEVLKSLNDAILALVTVKQEQQKPEQGITKEKPVINYTSKYEVAYGAKAFDLNAKLAKGIGTLAYSSSDTKVAEVSASGKVTVKGIGICTIIISLAESENYSAISVPVELTVKPKTVSLKSAKPAKGKKLNVKWKKDKTVTGYEVCCALKKNFKSGKKTVTVKKASKTSATIKNLKKGKKYYVHVRAYKTVKVNGKSQKIYGDWSKIKTSSKIK